MNILAIDVGTSSIKAAILEQAIGNPLGEIVHAAYPLQHPEVNAAVIEVDALWQALTQASRKVTANQQVQGVGVSCLSPCLVLLDDAGRPLTPFVTHLDRRARP